ncbi:amidohydrolase family protein [Marinigracilibium pacificum]|uniref:Amidohydrolase family protein n=1 Tax=Marinigracilibium pacificum TaxID=2729599 RepID=A0A848J1Y2_9BACT|nr:amidohydrolase family protein [Marinigracilibium pacificum]NMM48319.1 amidohydrolase family protein [Marinigracilibium pacificum]
MKKSYLIFLLFTLLFSNMLMAQQYDLVILNGRVMDPETMYDGIANVGVKDGRIAVITKDKITCKETIDATGLVVAPGFIDTHFHAQDAFATKMAVAGGVTTGMDLEAGSSRVGDWYDRRAKEGWQVNYGTTSSMLFARIMVHDPEVDMSEIVDARNGQGIIAASAADGVQGWAVTKSSIDQMNQIMKILDEDLRQGAIGIGITSAYFQRGVTSYEQFSAQRTAGRYGRLSSVHTRYHIQSQTPNEATIALDEVLANAMVLRAPLLLAHDNDYGWWENEEKLQLARAQGYNVWGEYYPYAAGLTWISADFLRPEVWEDINGYKYEETIFDPGTSKFLTKDEFLAMVEEKPGYNVVVHIPPRQKWMKYWLTIPEMVVASDASPGNGEDGKLLPYDADVTKYAGHPRTASCYAKTLELGREQGVPLMFTLSQLSYWNAKHLGDTGLEAMKERGRVQVGKVADLTLFNPQTVKANATYSFGENGLPPTGIPYVIVNGTIVVDKGEVLPVKPGQPIRFPVEEKGRFVPVDFNNWLGDFTINVPDMHEMDDTAAPRLKEQDKK